METYLDETGYADIPTLPILPGVSRKFMQSPDFYQILPIFQNIQEIS
jgi:hypothetical protein